MCDCDDFCYVQPMYSYIYIYMQTLWEPIKTYNTQCCGLFSVFSAGGPKKEGDEDDGVEPEAPEPFEWPDDI